MSTPCGIHNPIPPGSFDRRTDHWHDHSSGTEFRLADFAEVIELARAGDVVYCDPPYHHTQAILYGAQTFSVGRLFEAIAAAKARGAYGPSASMGRSGRMSRRCLYQYPTVCSSERRS